MRLVILQTGDSKFATMVRAFPRIWKGRILDVGCRSRKLKEALPSANVDYLGVDLQSPADIVGNLEAGLPLGQASSDTVVALDVLEHTDNIYHSFGDLCRVSRSYVLIALPNLYDVTARKRFLCGQQISGKYGLPLDPPTDRHRWIFSFQEAEKFTHAMATKCGFEVVDEGCLIGPRRGAIGFRELVKRYPNVLSPWYVALLKRKEINK